MQPLYRVKFNIRPALEHHRPSTLDDIIDSINAWLPETITRDIRTAEFREGTFRESQLGKKRGSVETVRDSDETTDHFGLRFEHADEQHTDAIWRTDITASKKQDTEVTIELSIGTQKSIARPVLQVNRPRIVPSLIDKFGAWIEGTPLFAQPILLDTDNIYRLPEIIFSKDRNIPIIYLSADNATDKPAADAQKIADQLAGIAIVIAATTHNDRIVRQKLGNLHSYNGAVRLYSPPINGQMESYMTEYWLKEVAAKNTFPSILLKRLSQDSLHKSAHITFDKIKQLSYLRKAQAISSGISPEDHAIYIALADSYAQENETLRVRNIELQKKVSELELEAMVTSAELTTKNELVDELQTTIRLMRSTPVEEFFTDVTVIRSDKKSQSIKDVCAYVQEKYQDRIVLTRKAMNQAAKSKFRDTDLVKRALEWIATKCTNGGREKDLVISALEDLGLTYQPMQNELTMRTYAADYFTTYEGRKISLERHLRTGGKPDEETTLRIAFGKDDVSQKIIIGYIGMHQRNTWTN